MEPRKDDLILMESRSVPLDGATEKPDFISQSEADSFLSCKRKHYYAFGEPCADGSHGIAPVSHNEAIQQGNIGHEGLAAFYTALHNRESWDAAVNYALNELRKIILADSTTLPLVAKITNLLSGYFEFYKGLDDYLEPVAVETEFRLELTEHNMVFPFKPDVVMRNKHTGEITVWDHKFVYNYFRENVLQIMPQLPKYIGALRMMGYDVADGVYNQISTRANSKNPYYRVSLGLTDARIERHLNEQIEAMLQIKEQKRRHPVVWKETALRTAGSYSCKGCPFIDLCVADLENSRGRDLLVNNFFEPNKYGYGKGESKNSES